MKTLLLFEVIRVDRSLSPSVILLALVRVHAAVVVLKNQMLLLCFEG